METSYNGWPASPTLKTRAIEPVPGFIFHVADNDNVADVFTYLIANYHKRVEPLRKGQYGSYVYRADRNDPSKLSCHASATAVDLNSLLHPNGAKGTFNKAQVEQMHAIITELDGTAQCGEFYIHTTDGMHWEINVPPGHLQGIGAKLRKQRHTPTAGPKIEKAISLLEAAHVKGDRQVQRDKALAILKGLRR